MSILFPSNSPVPSLINSSWDIKRYQGFPRSLSDHLEVCDTTSVRSYPLSALGKMDPKNLPLYAESPGLARLQGKTASDLLSFTPRSSKATPPPPTLAQSFNPAVSAVSTQAFRPLASTAPYRPAVAVTAPAPKPAATPPEKKDEGNIFQQGLKFLGDTAGAAVRGVGDVAGTVVGEVVKNNPLALVSRGASGVAGMMGASKEVTDALASVDKASGAVGDVAQSAVRGVGEFGAGTVEGVAQMAADPLAAAQGIGIAVSSGVDAIPVVGDLTTGAEAMVRGTSLDKVRQEKAGNRDAIWKGMVEEHQAIEGRVGAAGAWIKVGLDLGTIVKSGAVQGGKTAARVGAHVADDAAEAAAKVARHADDAVPGAGKTASKAPSQAGEVALQRHADHIDADASKGTVLRREDVPSRLGPPQSYHYKAPAGRDTSGMAFDPHGLTAHIEKRIGEFKSKNPDATDFVVQGEQNAMLDEAHRILRRAEDGGRVPKGIARDLGAQKMTAWLISKELKAGGVALSKETNDFFLPFKVTSHQEDLGSGVMLVKRSTEHADDAFGESDLIHARRAFETKPKEVSNGNGTVKAYNAQASDLAVLQSSVEDMRKYAPKLAGHLGEAHFEKMISAEMAERAKFFDPDTGALNPRASQSAGVTGSTFSGDSAYLQSGDTIVIKHVPPMTGTKKLSQGPVRLQETREFRLHGTIYHETSHLLDRGGVISKAPDSPFKISGPREDYVSKYAMTNPAEDFAETVRVVIQAQKYGDKYGFSDILNGAPITDALRAKLLRAADAIGADPAALKGLKGW